MSPIDRTHNLCLKYKTLYISLNFYPTALEPSEIDLQAKSTSKIDLTFFFFFPIPVPLDLAVKYFNEPKLT